MNLLSILSAVPLVSLLRVRQELLGRAFASVG
jgi:hypothetical protein